MSNPKLNAYNLWDGISRNLSEIRGITRGDDGEDVGGLELELAIEHITQSERLSHETLTRQAWRATIR
jgi:hypothetical protein